MAEEVKLTNSEVTTLYGTTDTYKIFKTKDGASVISFSVKTKLNDNIANCPCLFRSCSYYTKSEQELEKIKNFLTIGSIIEVLGVTERFQKKNKEWGEKVKVKGIIPILVTNKNDNTDIPQTDEDLPF